MIAQVTGLKVGEFVHTIGDAHLYSNHREQAQEQLDRPLDKVAPTLFLNPRIKDIDDFELSDIVIHNYSHYPAIKAPVAV
jgi:thymidylate synthase